ncbi:MAG: SCP2 sterol-binding domain-containing protein [Defluviitaleaceae bacterium]|nr:SCP2 sterol-binding domain-containing protein [Defluviitaleaceae bacterium]
MKIAYVYGNMSHYDHGLSTLVKRTQNVFVELGVEVDTIDLGVLHPPYYDGETTAAIDNLMEKLQNSDGVVFASTAQMFAPTALMQSFVEYLEHPDYAEVLKGKHCMLIALSRDGGERSALDYLSRVVQFNGGFSVAQIGLQVWHLNSIGGDAGDFIDKTTEDFYRAVHQNRKYVIPMDSPPKSATAVSNTSSSSSGVSASNATPTASANTSNVAQPANNVGDSSNVVAAPVAVSPQQTKQLQQNLKAFNETQEQEIDELSVLFAQKYTSGEGDDTASLPSITTPVSLVQFGSPTSDSFSSAAPAAPRVKTAQQITQSLPHYFQPQLSGGLQAVIQINITGAENFDGFLYIHSTECTYSEGTAPAPDIIIMADATIWLDVLRKKTTAQKAFMIGGIKVRGDFVLLTKFDSLFELPEA